MGQISGKKGFLTCDGGRGTKSRPTVAESVGAHRGPTRGSPFSEPSLSEANASTRVFCRLARSLRLCLPPSLFFSSSSFLSLSLHLSLCSCIMKTV